MTGDASPCLEEGTVQKEGTSKMATIIQGKREDHIPEAIVDIDRK